MKKTLASEVYDKVQEVLFTDKIKSPIKVGNILSSEIEYVLRQYFEIKENSFESRIFTEETGELDITFAFKAKRVLIKRGAEEQ